MKKLKTKTFFTLFIILSIFLVTILFIFNYQNYSREKSQIANNLKNINSMVFDNRKNKDDKKVMDYEPPKEDMVYDDLDKKIILDYDVYTVLLSNDNSIREIFSHNNQSDNSSINDIARDILDNNPSEGIIVKSLFISDYAYNYKNGNYLLIIDVSNVKARLLKNLRISLIIFIVFEIMIFYLSRLITKWLTKPALDSYQKQKDFIADASHELKTPVAVIMANADALEADMSEKKWLNNIKQETEKMNNLITNLLNLSKIENQFDKSMYELNDISKIVNKNILTFESLAFEKNVKIKDDIEDNIVFKSNALEMNELISILIDNAIKHADNKSTINVSLNKKSEGIVLKVANKGDEIDPKDYDKIFERFYRVDESHNRNSNRYGLGLAIAKSIVEKHDGKISVDSKEHITTFKVIFKK